MPRNPGLLPDEEGYGADDDDCIEVIQVPADEILCALLVECPEEVQEAAKKHWAEIVCPATANSMLKFIGNHYGV